jgi:hypothetical protein
LKKFNLKYFIFALIFLSASFLFPNSLSIQARKSIMLQFVAYNGFGNNLYIDNVITGRRNNFDLAMTSINNIPRDTSFIPGISSFNLLPSVNVTNIGFQAASDSFFVYLSIPELLISDSVKVGPLSGGQTEEALFSLISLPANLRFSTISYLKYSSDSLNMDDTIKQSSIFLPGAPKKVLLEEFTSATSPACGANNIFLDTFVNNHFTDICAIKYHLGFPPPGIDSLYIRDTAMVERRREYYFANTVPLSIIDGRSRIMLPYYRDSNIVLPFDNSRLFGSPVLINVANIHTAPDTIQSTIDVHFFSAVQSNKLFLRIAAVERRVDFAQPIGASGEMTFYDVCRKMLPDSIGFPISGNAGTSQYVVKYHVDSLWQDTSMYTIAFIQNDLDRTVINSGKSLIAAPFRKNYSHLKKPTIIKPDFDIKKFPPFKSYRNRYSPKLTDTTSYYNYELFEGPFPPLGWTISNIDGFLTFEKANYVNGVTLGGNSCIKMPFYDYANIGQKDTLYSVLYDSVSSYDTLTFDWAYAVYLSTFSDSLTVNISVDGGNTFTNIFDKGGYGMATALSTTLPFVPYSSAQWKTFKYALSQVIPQEGPQNIIPKEFELGQNYPNPFNPSTTISYKIPRDVFVSIKVYDVSGRVVATLVNETRKAGVYNTAFTAGNLSSGIYFYVLKAGDFLQAKKLVLLK